MKKTSSQRKAHVAPMAMVAGLGMAGMGLVSGGVVAATDITSVTDTLNVEVSLSCTFNSTTNKTYTGSAMNGAEVENFNDAGEHEFSLFCNGSNGYVVTATPHDLEATGIENVIGYTDNYTPVGTNGLWTAEIASESAGVTVVPVVPASGGTILSSDTGTTAAGVSFTAAYSAYVGTETPAGTYTGTIVYTLTASEASNNSGNGGNDNGGGSGIEPGNEVTDNTNGGGTGDSGTGIEPGSSNANSNSTSSTAPLLNNSYSTYNTSNTSNTYNTANYSGGSSASAPAVTSGSTNGTTSEDGDGEDDSDVSDSYEKPLGATTGTTSTLSTDEDSGVDLMPIVAVGALTAAGVATVALAKSGKKEEE